MDKTIDRLALFINHIGISARQFDLSIGAGNGYVLRMMKNKASIGSDILEKILEKYPQLNVVWLLTGKGTMIEDEGKIRSYDHLTLSDQKQIDDELENKIKNLSNSKIEKLIGEVNSEIERIRKELDKIKNQS